MRVRALVGLGVAGALLAGCGSSAATTPITQPTQTPAVPTGLERFYDQQVSWTNCGEGSCAKVQVPIDYAKPEGATIDLAVVKMPAKETSIGSLFVNPGGPGGSGFDYAKAADVIVSPEIRDAYDIIGVDPRGVGKSAPIRCLSDAQRDEMLEVDATPDSPAEEQALVDSFAEVARLCAEKGGDLIHHMTTGEAARDLDIVRAVVGDPSFNYLGLSYGTQLGATYAELFPTRVGRMVLDGVLPAYLDDTEITKGQSDGFEYAFNDFARDCSTHDDCPFTGTPDEVATQLRDFIASLDAKPIAVGKRTMNEAVAQAAVLSYLYFPDIDYPRLRTALTALVDKRNGKPLLDLLDERDMRDPDGRYEDNSTDAFFAVTCADSQGGVTRDEAKALATELGRTDPTFGTALGWGVLGCTDWPAQGAEAVTQTHANGSGPILVVSTRHDPATPYFWGVELSRKLANAVLLTREGTGHTGYLAGSSCIDEGIDGYLLRGELPTTTTCS